jgi:hypothetical protein
MIANDGSCSVCLSCLLLGLLLPERLAVVYLLGAFGRSQPQRRGFLRISASAFAPFRFAFLPGGEPLGDATPLSLFPQPR